MARGRWVRGMLDGALAELAEEARAEARVAARQEWVRERIAALKVAQGRADDAWMALVADMPEDGEDLDPPSEQAVVDAIWAELDDVRRIGRWPRALYWGLI